jgi:membrane protein DedA with SNARE-associated domain
MSLHEIANAVVAFVQANHQWAVPIVFLLAFGESLAFLSLLLPSTVVLVAISGLLGAGNIDFWPVWLAAGIGGSLGYALSYWLGLYFKNDVPGWWPFRNQPELLPRGQRFFDKYGAFGVFLGHFFGPIRAVIPVVAGMCAMRQIPFQIANVSSSFLWAGGVLAPGIFGMRYFEQIKHALGL